MDYESRTLHRLLAAEQDLTMMHSSTTSTVSAPDESRPSNGSFSFTTMLTSFTEDGIKSETPQMRRIVVLPFCDSPQLAPTLSPSHVLLTTNKLAGFSLDASSPPRDAVFVKISFGDACSPGKLMS